LKKPGLIANGPRRDSKPRNRRTVERTTWAAFLRGPELPIPGFHANRTGSVLSQSCDREGRWPIGGRFKPGKRNMERRGAGLGRAACECQEGPAGVSLVGGLAIAGEMGRWGCSLGRDHQSWRLRAGELWAVKRPSLPCFHAMRSKLSKSFLPHSQILEVRRM
jgi:hypothetical protein